MNFNIGNSSPTFSARCPEIKLGQQVCHVVNNEFPHYSMSKFKPLIHKGRKVNYGKIMMLINKLFAERPIPDGTRYPDYFADLFDFIKEYHSFNCHEASLLSALTLKLNGLKNVYTAEVLNGTAEIDHIVCFFNRDGSKYDGEIKNNKTIIVDAWTGLCDFANNVFQEYSNGWRPYFSTYYNGEPNDIYTFNEVKEMSIPKSSGFMENVQKAFPNLILKKMHNN